MGAMNRVRALLNSSFNVAGLPVAFTQVAQIAQPIGILRIINNSNVPVIISYNGVDDNDYLPANTILQLDFQANAIPTNEVALLAKDTRIYAKGPGAGVGFLVVTGYFVQRH